MDPQKQRTEFDAIRAKAKRAGLIRYDAHGILILVAPDPAPAPASAPAAPSTPAPTPAAPGSP